MRNLWILLALSCAPRCPIDLDRECAPTPECASAAEGAACEAEGQRCNLCERSYHSYLATCDRSDAGLRWSVARGTPPPGCPPR